MDITTYALCKKLIANLPPSVSGETISINIEEIENGHRVVLTDGQGTHNFDVLDGKGISDVTLNNDYTLTFTYTDGTTDTTSSIQGPTGPNGPAGADGATFRPYVSSSGILSWTNNGNKQNPESVNIVQMVLNALPDGDIINYPIADEVSY